MSSIRMSPNSREVIGAISTITGKQEYLKSTNGALTIAGSFSLTGQAIPASGLTTAVAVQIVDGSGNQIASFGGGTQYTDGGVPPTHPIGNTIEWSDGSNWQTVSSAKPLPVTASFSPSGTQDVNLTKVSGSAFALGQQLAAASLPIVLTASQLTTLTPPAAITNYALETGGNLATLAGTVTSSVLQTNEKQINGVAPLMGNGVTGTGSQRVTIASDNTAFSVNATLSAETTKVIGTVNQGTSPWVISGSLTANQSVNVAQINGVTPLMGNGVTGTGSQRVTIASDNTAFSVNATLSAETTKVIGVTRTADGSGNLLTSTANALDINIKSGSIANTSFAVTQGTAANLNATVVGTGTFQVQTTAQVPGTGATNLGKAEDAAHSSGDTGVFALGVRNDALGTTFTNTNGDYSPLAVDSTGTLFTNVNTVPTSTDRTGSGTISALNGTVVATTNGCSTVQFTVGSLGTAQLTIEGFDGTNWNTLEGDQDATDTVESIITQNGLVTVPCGGFSQVRLRASTYSSGTVTVSWNAGAGLALVEIFNTNGTSLRVQDLASGTPGATAPSTAQMQGNLAKTALPTAVTDGQLVNNVGDKFGRQVILNNAFRDIMGTQTTTITASVSETTIITQVASTFLDLVSVFISNTSAMPVSVAIKDATAGSTIFTLYIPAGDMRGISLTTPWPQTTVNNNWTATSSGSVSSLIVSALFIKNK